MKERNPRARISDGNLGVALRVPIFLTLFAIYIFFCIFALNLKASVMRYLDPKADLTFKLVFGEHPDLVRSLLNALLPLPEGHEIREIEYVSPEEVPENPLRKNSIVDVRCCDAEGRQFLVEMQMVWSPEFRQRVLFNASKAYVRQAERGWKYGMLEPVYSLNLVNEVFEPELEGFYHYYQMVHVEHTEKVIEGLHLVFVELPKFTPHTYSERRMQVLWLRYLTEIDENTREAPPELLANPEVKKALSVVEEAAFTDEQLLGYEKFWDIISVEKTLYSSGFSKGMEEGRAQGRAQGKEEGRAEGKEEGREEGREEGKKKGLEEGREKGKEEEKLAIARGMKGDGMPVETIAKYTGLSAEEIGRL